MVRILGLSGSLRQGSYNSALLRAAADVIGSDATLEIGSIRGISREGWTTSVASPIFSSSTMKA